MTATLVHRLYRYHADVWAHPQDRYSIQRLMRPGVWLSPARPQDTYPVRKRCKNQQGVRVYGDGK